MKILVFVAAVFLCTSFDAPEKKQEITPTVEFSRFIISVYYNRMTWCDKNVIQMELVITNKSEYIYQMTFRDQYEVCSFDKYRGSVYSISNSGDTLYWIPDIGYKYTIVLPRSTATLRFVMAKRPAYSILNILHDYQDLFNGNTHLLMSEFMGKEDLELPIKFDVPIMKNVPLLLYNDELVTPNDSIKLKMNYFRIMKK